MDLIRSRRFLSRAALGLGLVGVGSLLLSATACGGIRRTPLTLARAAHRRARRARPARWAGARRAEAGRRAEPEVAVGRARRAGRQGCRWTRAAGATYALAAAGRHRPPLKGEGSSTRPWSDWLSRHQRFRRRAPSLGYGEGELVHAARAAVLQHVELVSDEHAVDGARETAHELARPQLKILTGW